jgi:protein-tyrosine phosphatase
MPHRTFEIEGLANARDLGGLERTDGTLTPSGVFFRSEATDRVTTEGWDRMLASGIRTIIDIRRPGERSGEVPQEIERIQVDLDGDERDFWDPVEADGRWATPLYYPAHLAELPHRMAGVLAILFHCIEGWDRTGFVSAMLQKAIDVTADAAASDYLRSFDNAEALAALRERPSNAHIRKSVMREFGHSPDSAIRQTYDRIYLDDWFDAAGVSANTRAQLRTWRGAVVEIPIAKEQQ